VPEQALEVVGELVDGVAAHVGRAGAAVAADVEPDDAVLVGEAVDLVVPGVGVLPAAVDADQRRSAPVFVVPEVPVVDR